LPHDLFISYSRRDKAQVSAELNKVGRPFGIQFGSGA
jgi:hypothetical protein